MYLDEKSYDQMADVLGISPNHVGVKLHRIKNTLADWLEEEPGAPTIRATFSTTRRTPGRPTPPRATRERSRRSSSSGT